MFKTVVGNNKLLFDYLAVPKNGHADGNQGREDKGWFHTNSTYLKAY